MIDVMIDKVVVREVVVGCKRIMMNFIVVECWRDDGWCRMMVGWGRWHDSCWNGRFFQSSCHGYCCRFVVVVAVIDGRDRHDILVKGFGLENEPRREMRLVRSVTMVPVKDVTATKQNSNRKSHHPPPSPSYFIIIITTIPLSSSSSLQIHHHHHVGWQSWCEITSSYTIVSRRRQ